jgi:hypothetical protein
LIGAAQTAASSYNTFKGAKLRSISKSEAIASGRNTISDGAIAWSRRPVLNRPDWYFYSNSQATTASKQAPRF